MRERMQMQRADATATSMADIPLELVADIVRRAVCCALALDSTPVDVSWRASAPRPLACCLGSLLLACKALTPMASAVRTDATVAELHEGDVQQLRPGMILQLLPGVRMVRFVVSNRVFGGTVLPALPCLVDLEVKHHGVLTRLKRRCDAPAVPTPTPMGELLAGICLGPTSFRRNNTTYSGCGMWVWPEDPAAHATSTLDLTGLD